MKGANKKYQTALAWISFFLIVYYTKAMPILTREQESTDRDNVFISLSRAINEYESETSKFGSSSSNEGIRTSNYSDSVKPVELEGVTSLSKGRPDGSTSIKSHTVAAILNKSVHINEFTVKFEQPQQKINQHLAFEGTSKYRMDQPAVIHDIELKGEQGVDGDLSDSNTSHPFIGVLLAVGAAILVGISFIFQKKGLLITEANKKGKNLNREREGTLGQFSYCLQWMWWCGMLSLAIGEVMNFIAYSIAPAILITPLGALRVIVSAILSSIFLNERLNTHGKIGVLLSVVGSVMVIIHAPRREKVHTFEQVIFHFTDATFLLYCAILIGITIFIIVHVAPRRGRTDIMVYISVCNIVGALCVLCGKGLGIALKEIGRLGDQVLLHPLFWILVAGNVVGIIVQIIYLNKSLAIFNTSMVTPIKYVFTNIFLVIGSILLFQEFTYMSVEDTVGISCGFITVVTGIVLLNCFKEGSAVAFTAIKR